MMPDPLESVSATIRELEQRSGIACDEVVFTALKCILLNQIAAFEVLRALAEKAERTQNSPRHE